VSVRTSRHARERLIAHVRDTLFSPTPAAIASGRRIGAEVELLPLDADTRRMCPLESGQGRRRPAVLPFLRRHAARHHWTEEQSSKGAPLFRLPDGGSLTFEPGGQVEYSSPPCQSASALIERLHAAVLPMRSAACEEGIDLVAAGIDPQNPIERVPLQLRVDRYCRMADYFATIGPAGARMMRQTAALQVNLDLEVEPTARWHILNAAAPYVVAIFANSPRYGGLPTGEQSYRARVWRELDPRRTGIVDLDGDAAAAYVEFALQAPSVMSGAVGGAYLPFSEWLDRGQVSEADWRTHLTTLSPEVRPRGYLEVRSADTIPPEWYAAPIALLSGITYHYPTRLAAAELLGSAEPELLVRAGTLGLRDPAVGRIAIDLFELSLTGCRALGEAFLSAHRLEVARSFADRYVCRGRSPADDVHQGRHMT